MLACPAFMPASRGVLLARELGEKFFHSLVFVAGKGLRLHARSVRPRCYRSMTNARQLLRKLWKSSVKFDSGRTKVSLW